MTEPRLLCVGEVLWDSVPGGLFLGGAPLNVARHLRAQGLPVSIASRVGADRLGEEAVERLAREGVDTELIQVDSNLPTGFVKAVVDGDGVAEYEIVRPAAWDAIELTDSLLECADRAEMVVFGTLAQRSPISRYAIERLWETESLKAYDVNLRPPYEPPDTVRRSLTCADVVKVNEHELAKLGRWFGCPGPSDEAAAALAELFNCSVIAVTRGEDGAALWRQGRWTEHPGFEVAVRDTIGAGDAFFAELLAGIRRGDDDFDLLHTANARGAWVASQVGAVPLPDAEAVASVARRSLRRRRSVVAPGAA